ncbi:hypothetical protein [Actinomadura sp. GTD37]|uniref:hypothetical protein n=1 Tax=Actinomadura sp. GTD37 TaxID=1778030 RepID=UPI0035BF0887
MLDCLDVERALHQVRLGGLVDRVAAALAPVDPLDAGLAHEPLDPHSPQEFRRYMVMFSKVRAGDSPSRQGHRLMPYRARRL